LDNKEGELERNRGCWVLSSLDGVLGRAWAEARKICEICVDLGLLNMLSDWMGSLESSGQTGTGGFVVNWKLCQEVFCLRQVSYSALGLARNGCIMVSRMED